MGRGGGGGVGWGPFDDVARFVGGNQGFVVAEKGEGGYWGDVLVGVGVE